MSVASEITRLQNAKADLKSSINAKTDAQHQITNETIDDYADFVDSIETGGGGHDWTALGYTEEPEYISDGYTYAKQIYDTYDTSTTDWTQRYYQDTDLVFMPYVDTTNVTNMRQAFRECIYLLKVPGLNVSNVENTGWMFGNCSSLRDIDLTNFDTSKVTKMDYMFFRCFTLRNETIPLDTSNVDDMSHMFEACWSLLELDISSFTTPKLTSAVAMFYNCRSLTKLDARNFDFTRLTSSSSRTDMFGSSASYGPPNNCLIIVKNDTQKNWFRSYYSRFNNVKTVAEYEAS